MKRYDINIDVDYLEESRGGTYVLYSAAQAEIECLNGIVNEVNEEAGKARMILLFNHGHKGQYVDDGEMQCGACGAANYDFKKPSLSELVKRIIFGFNTEINRLKEENQRVRIMADNLLNIIGRIGDAMEDVSDIISEPLNLHEDALTEPPSPTAQTKDGK